MEKYFGSVYLLVKQNEIRWLESIGQTSCGSTTCQNFCKQFAWPQSTSMDSLNARTGEWSPTKRICFDFDQDLQQPKKIVAPETC